MKKSVSIYESVVRCVKVNKDGSASIVEVNVPYKNAKEAFRAIDKLPLDVCEAKIVPVAVAELVVSTYKVESDLLHNFLQENGELVDSGRSIIADESDLDDSAI